MALQAPPGHPAQPAALIAAQFAGLTLNVKPPDADLQVITPPAVIGPERRQSNFDVSRMRRWKSTGILREAPVLSLNLVRL